MPISPARRRAHHAKALTRRRAVQGIIGTPRPAVVTAPTPKGRFGRISPKLSAITGKRAAVAVAGLGAAKALMSNSGRATDVTRGRPTGMYRF